MTNYWRKFYLAPASYAEQYTRWSRNILNIGLAALICSVFYAWHLPYIGFAFSSAPETYFSNMKKYDGIYRFVSGGKSSTPRACIIDEVKKTEIICTSAFDAMSSSGYLHGGKRAHALVEKDIGIVKLVVDGEDFLTPNSLQHYLRINIKKCLWLIAIFLLTSSISIFRQWLILNKKDQK